MDITAIDHVGIRVTDKKQALEFYERFGFRVREDYPDHAVTIVANDRGVELNLISNAVSPPQGRNVLMDVDVKHPGHTHFALRVPSLQRSLEELRAAGLQPSGGPERLGRGISAFFRDPDRNVLELRESTE